VYTAFRNVRLREALVTELPSLGLALATAEVCYKFHSFTLECVCFLVTWFVFSFVLSLATRGLGATAAHTGE
jgi:hypothetical protein